MGEHLLDQGASRQSRVTQCQRISQAVAQAQVLTRGERMIANHQCAQRLFGSDCYGDVLTRRRVVRQDEIDLIADQCGHQILRRADADVKADVRMLGVELSNDGWQQLARDRLDGGDADLTADQAAQLLDLRFDCS